MGDCGDAETDHEGDGGAPATDLPAWAPVPMDPGCPECAGEDRQSAVVAGVSPLLRNGAARGGGEVTRRLVRREVEPGQRMACVFAGTEVAGWLGPGARWWPRPRRVAEALATARWHVSRCQGCHCYRASLAALQRIPAGGEVTVGRNPSLEAEDALWPWEVTFDGGADTGPNAEAAGAGATLWKHDLAGGPPRCVARAVVAIPWAAGAPLAEALGCKAGLDLLRQAGGDCRRARVVGDNLGVIRYCAGTARLRALPQQALLEAALGAALAQGWQLDWQAVRRPLNAEADRLATQGTRWARALRRSGVTEVRQHIEWESG